MDVERVRRFDVPTLVSWIRGRLRGADPLIPEREPSLNPHGLLVRDVLLRLRWDEEFCERFASATFRAWADIEPVLAMDRPWRAFTTPARETDGHLELPQGAAGIHYVCELLDLSAAAQPCVPRVPLVNAWFRLRDLPDDVDHQVARELRRLSVRLLATLVAFDHADTPFWEKALRVGRDDERLLAFRGLLMSAPRRAAAHVQVTFAAATVPERVVLAAAVYRECVRHRSSGLRDELDALELTETDRGVLHAAWAGARLPVPDNFAVSSRGRDRARCEGFAADWAPQRAAAWIRHDRFPIIREEEIAATDVTPN